MPHLPQATLAVVAEFPEKYFLENMAVRADNSMLITVNNEKELWFVPSVDGAIPVRPQHLFTFDFNLTFCIEWQPDRFLVGVADVYGDKRAQLYEVDLRGWMPGTPIVPRLVLEFPEPWSGLNGACFVRPNVFLAAGVANVIWRVDIAADESMSARLWLEHDTMKNRPGQMKPEQPGTNGVQFDASTGFVYYTTTSQQMMLRVATDPATCEPTGLPEFVAGGREWDDFVIDERAGVAYVTTHRENTIDLVRLAHDGNRAGRSVSVGDPFNDLLVGPSAGAWGRAPGQRGRVAFFSSDGGTAQPPDGKYRTAKVLRIEFPPVPSEDGHRD